MSGVRQFEQCWCVDFEFTQPPAEVPTPICMVARELFSGQLIRMWEGEFTEEPPFPTDGHTLFVAYLASAELNCFRQLGWADPANVLDLYVEHRWLKNGLALPPELRPHKLLTMLQLFGLDSISAAEKEEMRQLAIRGGPFTDEERRELLDYCQLDVDALAQLIPHVDHLLDWPRALLRGEYMKAVSAMETRGVPIDVELFDRFKNNCDFLRHGIIDAAALKYDLWEGRQFKQWKFIRLLAERGLLLDWPRTASQQPKTDGDTLRDMAQVHPWLMDLRETVATADLLKRNELAIGKDGRNRTLLSPFASKTGRNQPSNSKFIFGPATWIRGLIRPARGHAIAYCDWQQQELAIVAALSGDRLLMDSYRSGDPYLTLAKLAGAVPQDATPEQYPAERDLYKKLCLGINYGMGPVSIARSIGDTVARAEHLLQMHREIYRTYWRWSEAAVNHCLLHGYLHTRFGWRVYLDDNPNPRSLANYPAQANGAEMMRIAAIMMLRKGLPVCCPVHDAFLVEGPEDLIDDIVRDTVATMEEASRVVLDGFTVTVESKVIRWPGRYSDKRGRATWDFVEGLLSGVIPSAEAGGGCG